MASFFPAVDLSDMYTIMPEATKLCREATNLKNETASDSLDKMLTLIAEVPAADSFQAP